MSSAAATRTSTGNITGSASRATPARSSAEHVEHGLAGNRVLRLDEPDPARRHEHLVRRRGVPAVGQRGGGEPVQRLDRRGTARPVRQSAPKAAFSITSYSRNRRQPGIGDGIAAPPRRPVRLFRLTQGVLAVREPVELEVVVACRELAEPPSTSSTCIGRSSAASVKAGTHCSVTVEMHAERADGHAGGVEQVGALLGRAGDDGSVGEHQLEPATWVAMPPRPAPVPCVPVEIAPEIVCASMSPRFGMARPSESSARSAP